MSILIMNIKMEVFLTIDKKEYIYNLISKNMLKNLNKTEFDQLMTMLFTLIDYISVCFAINPINYDSFWIQLTQNTNRDIIGIFNLLLPFIDDKEGSFELHNSIYYLSDIKTKKNPNKYDQTENNFMISNIQYNHCDINVDNNAQLNTTSNIFNIDKIKKNYILLLDTIRRISNKLFTNWLNIRPLCINTYMNSYLYKSSYKMIIKPTNNTVSIKYYDNNIQIFEYSIHKNDYYFVSMEDYDKYINDKIMIEPTKFIRENLILSYDNDLKTPYVKHENLFKHQGISIYDIFNTLYHHLYYDIIKIKWLIYQQTFDDSNHDEIYIKKFNEYIAIEELYKKKNWSELDINRQYEFTRKWNDFLLIVQSFDKSNSLMEHNGYHNLLLNIIIFMERNYSKMNFICHNFNYDKIISDDLYTQFDDYDNDDDDNNDHNLIKNKSIEISTLNLIQRIKSIPLSDIYEYLLETIDAFSNTWYGKNIILHFDPNNSKHHNYGKSGKIYDEIRNIKFNYESCSNEYLQANMFENIDIIFPENLTVKYKFFYNYGKAFACSIDANGKKLPNAYFHNMSSLEKTRALNFLQYTYFDIYDFNNAQTKHEDKFNVQSFLKYYRRTYINSTYKYKTLNNTMINLFDEGYYDIKTNHKITPKKYLKNLGMIVGDQMLKFIKNKLIDIVFQSHIIKGLLGEFICDFRLTDYTFLGQTYDDKLRNQFSNISKYIFETDAKENYMSNAFYFLTSKPYGDMYEIHRNSKKNYFDLLCSEYRWYSFYSMDWISQINFYHKYINNRVMYVTGATGQGKSTQIPKLFVYALLMIDNKPNGKVICSVPRINPTLDNSEQISWELGLPIFETSANLKQKIKTFNSIVQYETKDNKHVVSNSNGLNLTIVTDKLLYMKLVSNPLFKQLQKFYDDNSVSDAVESNIYMADNLYDVIIVDESHEHSVNMDMILTLARDTIKFNNSLRLIIVSATMTDDEPIYRRYYKEINDNFFYPYNFSNAEFDLDRLYIDRRMHISPPGETTQHKVTDIYLDFEPLSYDEAEKIAINKTIELANNSNISGDILFFSLGVEQIKKVCKFINSNLASSSSFICLPFYRGLPNEWNLTNDLSKKLKQIIINREDLFDAIYPSFNNIPRIVGPGTYTRAIIVATNIAEASITINSLKYVIDTGYYINVSDDPVLDKTIIENKLISEQSRLQRRGRVGRVTSGTVYYMYKKQSRLNIKPERKMCTDNIMFELWEISHRISNDELLFVNFKWLDYINNSIANLTSTNIFNNNPNFLKSNIYKHIVYTQYSYKHILLPSIINFINAKYYNNFDILKSTLESHIDITYFKFNINILLDLISNRTIRFLSGYDIQTDIYDPYGLFYIVHPEEKTIMRNSLTGKIIGNLINHNDQINNQTNNQTDNQTDNQINNEFSQMQIVYPVRIDAYMKKCFYYGLFINNNIEITNKNCIYDPTKYDLATLNLNYEKSVFGRIVQQIMSNLNISLHDSINMNRALLLTIIYSYIVHADQIVIIMIALLNLSNYKLSGLNTNYKLFIQQPNFIKLSEIPDLSNISDLMIYYELGNKILRYLNQANILSTDYYMQIFEHEKKQYLEQKKQILHDLTNKNNYWNLFISHTQWDKFNALSNTNKLDIQKNISDFMSESVKNIDNQIITNIMNLLHDLSIDVDFLSTKKFLTDYLKIKNSIDKLTNAHNISNASNDFEWFKYNLPVRPELSEWINVKKSFIYGFGLFQTVIYDDFYNLFNSIIIGQKKFKFSSDTLTKPTEMMVYLFEKSKNNDNDNDNEMSILIDTDIDTLVECNSFGYVPIHINNLFFSFKQNINLYRKILNKFYSVQKQKFKYINHMTNNHNLMLVKNKFTNGLFKYSNNYVQYLIKLWSIDVNANFNKNQYGGYNKQIETYELLTDSKIKYLIDKLNLHPDKLFILIRHLIKCKIIKIDSHDQIFMIKYM